MGKVKPNIGTVSCNVWRLKFVVNSFCSTRLNEVKCAWFAEPVTYLVRLNSKLEVIVESPCDDGKFTNH